MREALYCGKKDHPNLALRATQTLAASFNTYVRAVPKGPRAPLREFVQIVQAPWVLAHLWVEEQAAILAFF